MVSMYLGLLEELGDGERVRDRGSDMKLRAGKRKFRVPASEGNWMIACLGI